MELTQWLLRQIPVVVVMGIMIYAMFKYIEKKDKIIKSKDESLMGLAEKVLVVAAMWEVKSNLNTKEHEKILEGVDELKDCARAITTLCKK